MNATHSRNAESTLPHTLHLTLQHTLQHLQQEEAELQQVWNAKSADVRRLLAPLERPPAARSLCVTDESCRMSQVSDGMRHDSFTSCQR